jgi:hypothetical protein
MKINSDGLAVNKIFDSDEVIVELGEESGREFDMRMFVYYFVKRGEQVFALCNVRGEVFSDGELYSDYSKRLAEVVLTKEEAA